VIVILNMILQLAAFAPAIYMGSFLTKTYSGIDFAPIGLQLVTILLSIAPVVLGAWIYLLYVKISDLRCSLTSCKRYIADCVLDLR
jgi:hypothetical protein